MLVPMPLSSWNPCHELPNRQFQVRICGKLSPNTCGRLEWTIGIDYLLVLCIRPHPASTKLQMPWKLCPRSRYQWRKMAYSDLVLAHNDNDNKIAHSRQSNCKHWGNRNTSGYKHTNLEWQHSTKKTGRASQHMLNTKKKWGMIS